MTLRNINHPLLTLSGSPRLLGVIDFTSTAKTNAEATTPFNAADPALGGKVLLLQATQDVFVLPVSDSTGDAASATSVLLYAGERVILTMDSVNMWLSAVRSTADGNLKVWELV